MRTEIVRVNIVPGGVPAKLHVSQYDVGFRTFTFVPYDEDGGVPYVEGASVTLEATKPDNRAVINNCLYNDTGTVTYTLQQQLAAVAGSVWSKLVFRDTNGDVLATAAVLWIVDRAGVADDAIASDSDISALQEFVQEFGTINAYRQKLDAVAAAVGGPNAAATAAEMTDEAKVYVYTGETTSDLTYGHWYYYDEGTSAWVDGGVYNAAAVETDKTLSVEDVPADAKAVGDALATLDTKVDTGLAALLADLAPLYSASSTYAVGDYATQEGTIYKCTTAIETAEEWTAAHWVSVVALTDLGARIAELKSDFDDFAGEEMSPSPVSDWEQGEFQTATGEPSFATNRIRTVESGIPANVKAVTAINGYKFLVYAWEADSYLGIWDGTGFNSTSAAGLTITSLDLRAVYLAGATKVRLILMRNTISEVIAPSEGVNLVYTVYENYIPTIKADIDSLENFVDDVKVLYQHGNVYQARTDELNNRYYYRSNGALAVGINTDYIGFIVPVLPHRNYTLTRSNLLLLKEDKTLLSTSGGNYDVAGARTYYSGEAYYFAVSVRRADIPDSGYVISMGDSLDDGDYSLATYTDAVPLKRVLGANMISGALADGETHTISGKCGIRDGYYAAFLGKFSSFGTLTLKFNGVNVTNAVSVDATNLTIVSGIGNTITQPHGLTIANGVAVLLELKNSVMYITVESGGVKYQYHCDWYWTGSSMSEIGVVASGMSFTDTNLSVRFKSAERSIWYFGDSYSEFNMESRLPYYVIEYGFDKNIMFNSVSGSSSTVANEAFTTLLAYGNPKYAINATGMNDGSDVNDTTPNATWLTNIQAFILLCQRHDIIPVLCTVPTIPTVNNNGKNAWVKGSGYRYIDMASAVGADASGNWYAGMLSNDNIHPSPLGAVAQFMQLVTDMPEVMG